VGEEKKGLYFDLSPSSAFESDKDDSQSEEEAIRKLMNLQRALMHACGVFDLPPDIALLVTATALHGETVELVNFFGDLTKPWKRQKEIHLPAVKEEAIDNLHFLLQIFVLLGMDAQEVVELYVKKNRLNFERIRAKLGAESV